MVVYIVIGFLSGIISGMGIGGGTLLIPALTIICNINQQQAQNINLIYFIPTAIVALFFHHKDGNIVKSILPKIVIFGIIGAGIGSMIALKLEPDVLKKAFGVFLLLMGINELRAKTDENK